MVAHSSCWQRAYGGWGHAKSCSGKFHAGTGNTGGSRLLDAHLQPSVSLTRLLVNCCEALDMLRCQTGLQS